MFVSTSPEKVGVSSKNLVEYLDLLNERGLNMHSMLIAKGNKLFFEAYWSPFSANDNQRMYSTTKSYVGIAICQLASEGKISLDDKIVDYFKDKIIYPIHPYLQAQTIRHMLMMQTCMTDNNWFEQNVNDRLKHYFEHKPCHYPGTGFYYDSSAAFVLGALVERITNMPLLEYLRSFALDKIGFSKTAKCLKVPGGYSWGDSGLLCTPLDMLKVGRLVADDGFFENQRLINEKAMEYLLSSNSDTYEIGPRGYDAFGYSSFVWRTYDDSIMFSGMHDQLMIYNPKTDILFVCTGGNTSSFSRELIISGLFELIIRPFEKNLFVFEDKYSKILENKISSLALPVSIGIKQTDYENKISGKKFSVEENDLGITDFTLFFNEDYCDFIYHNNQGLKAIKFGRCENVIQQFPEYGYSDEYGSDKTSDHQYRCVASFAWAEEKKINMSIQIIDEYIGVLTISIGFNKNHAWVQMKKEAEDFLNEYEGSFDAILV